MEELCLSPLSVSSVWLSLTGLLRTQQWGTHVQGASSQHEIGTVDWTDAHEFVSALALTCTMESNMKVRWWISRGWNHLLPIEAAVINHSQSQGISQAGI